jgi:hypothetical protein
MPWRLQCNCLSQRSGIRGGKPIGLKSKSSVAKTDVLIAPLSLMHLRLQMRSSPTHQLRHAKNRLCCRPKTVLEQPAEPLLATGLSHVTFAMV